MTPTPRLHPDDGPAPARGDWSLYAWVPIVLAVACIRAARYHVSGALYAAAERVNPAPALSEDQHDALSARIMRAVGACEGRDRGGAT